MCRHHQTSPDSHFTRNRVCSLATPLGRKTLSGMKLIETGRNGARHVRAVTEDAEYCQFLREQFGVRLPKGSVLSHANL
jgi:N-hydroxyarylamine O-acetyltransferase